MKSGKNGMRPTEEFLFKILLGFLTVTEIVLTSAIKKVTSHPIHMSHVGPMHPGPDL